MNISIERKKAEAISRMKMLGIFPETIRQFEEDGYISRSDPPLGAFYWVEGEELESIRDFEKQFNGLVYLVIRSYTPIGVMDCYLYVSDYEDEWGMDRDDLKANQTLAYVKNVDDPDLSELGAIGIRKTSAAGLRRVW